MSKKATKLDKLRAQIDAVDKIILSMLAKRIQLVTAIGKYKRANNMATISPKRRDALKRTWTTRAKTLKIPASLVQEIFELIHNYSVLVEKNTR